jgi:hypothetical protein
MIVCETERLPENLASNTLLTRLGFTQNGSINLYGSEDNLYKYQPIY